MNYVKKLENMTSRFENPDFLQCLFCAFILAHSKHFYKSTSLHTFRSLVARFQFSSLFGAYLILIVSLCTSEMD